VVELLAHVAHEGRKPEGGRLRADLSSRMDCDEGRDLAVIDTILWSVCHLTEDQKEVRDDDRGQRRRKSAGIYKHIRCLPYNIQDV